MKVWVRKYYKANGDIKTVVESDNEATIEDMKEYYIEWLKPRAEYVNIQHYLYEGDADSLELSIDFSTIRASKPIRIVNVDA